VKHLVSAFEETSPVRKEGLQICIPWDARGGLLKRTSPISRLTRSAFRMKDSAFAVICQMPGL
jgi:hypothetical protein